MAAKGLVNITSSRRDLRLKVVAELSDEIKLVYKGQIDPVVGAYLQNLIHQK
jgi:uncharacterized protein YhdP